MSNHWNVTLNLGKGIPGKELLLTQKTLKNTQVVNCD